MSRAARRERPVVVAVDGSEPAYAAVRFAVEEATRLGVDLEIIHVIPAQLPAIARAPVDHSSRRYGHQVLERAEAYAVTVGEHPRIHARMHEGSRVAALANCSEDAALLVLGSNHVAVASHVWTGSTVAGVCSRATCPVVVVPSTWSGRDRMSRVVAGFKSPKHANELFTESIELADDLGAELLVLHAWKLQGAYDDIVVERVGRQQWELHVLAEMEASLRTARADHPAVSVRLDVQHDQPAHALVAASRAADRVLLSRPVDGSLLHHLGATLRAVLREAHCPVQVVPTGLGGADTHALVLERQGELLR